MFGGITILDEDLNLNIYKELLTLVMGPIFQVILFYIIYLFYKNGYVSPFTYEKVKIINIFLFSFNLLPILPLDGGKLINNTLDLILPYKLSHQITIFISMITLPILIIFDNKLIIVLIIFFLIIQIKEEIKIDKYRFKKLLLERELKGIIHKKEEKITNIDKVKRNKNFIIKINDMNLHEKDYFKYIKNMSFT